ncbi:MAG: hypothetical protein LBK45_00420 [Tannerellaceae bacterium]|jgi:hypothetical protein|nr:hypothetical protein [Tannerellaceae bacterium]
MKTKIVSKEGRIFLVYRGEDYGSYPSGLISVERKTEKSLIVRLGVSTLFAESIENTLIGDAQLTPDDFEELTKGIDGGSSSGSGEGMSAEDKSKLDNIIDYVTSISDGEATSDGRVKLEVGYRDPAANTTNHEQVFIPTATTDTAGVMTAADKKKLDGLAPDNWAYNEADTGATFVDGKKIYSKTIDCGALPNNGTNVIEHGIANVDNIIEMTAFATDGTYCFPLNYCSPNATSNIGVYIDKSNIYPVTGKDMRAFNATIKLKYTCTDR